MSAELVDALGGLISTLFESLGPDRTLGLIVIVLLLSVMRRLYLDWRADRLMRAALDEKEKSIQRLNNQEREWRRLFLLLRTDLSADQVDSIVLRNEFSTPQQARRALEQKPSKNKRVEPRDGNTNDHPEAGK